MKKLKLRIAKFDRLLVVEQLEREGEFRDTEHVKLTLNSLSLSGFEIRLSKRNELPTADVIILSDNQERDECAANFVKWITEEQFGGSGNLEIGKPCLVSNDGKNWYKFSCFAGKVAKKLGIDKRFLIKIENEDDEFYRWKYAKPLNSVQPTIDGEFYTWEID